MRRRHANGVKLITLREKKWLKSLILADFESGIRAAGAFD
jgi:hypothetical protein